MTMQGWELQDIHLRRGQTPVFAGLHLQLHEARIGLIGFNGAGKTSLLRMLAGLDVPQQGRIVRQGETLHSAERGHAPSRRVGLMFQNPDDQIIFPTVQEELQLSWRSAHPGSSRAQAAQAVADFLQQRGLAHWAERAVGSLSQGQRQWVCWLAMRVAQPEVLLLDEPCSALDPISTAKIEELIAELKSEYTVVIVTHNMQQAARCSDFTAYMYLGDLVEFGATEQMFFKPQRKETEDYITGRFG